MQCNRDLICALPSQIHPFFSAYSKRCVFVFAVALRILFLHARTHAHICLHTCIHTPRYTIYMHNEYIHTYRQKYIPVYTPQTQTFQADKIRAIPRKPVNRELINKIQNMLIWKYLGQRLFWNTLFVAFMLEGRVTTASIAGNPTL